MDRVRRRVKDKRVLALVKAFRTHNWGRIRPGLNVRVSIGVAVLPAGTHSGEAMSLIRELMERADRALYRAKQTGRDKYEIAEGSGIPAGSMA